MNFCVLKSLGEIEHTFLARNIPILAQLKGETKNLQRPQLWGEIKILDG